MAYQNRSNCLHYSFFFAFLLFFQFTYSQAPWDKTTAWLNNNIIGLGGNAVLLVYKNGKPVYLKSINAPGRIKQRIAAKKNININLDENTPTYIASCSKWLSAALVMTFVDEGELTLNDTVGKFLPVFTEYGKGNITIADCLSHLTGTKSERADNKDYVKMSNMDKVMLYIAQKPLSWLPGTTFYYGSDGLQIAGAIIEKISGKSFETLFKERIAVPLQMKHTDFGNKAVALPAGGARSSAADYMIFLEMLLNNGTYKGKQILTPASVKAMETDYTSGKKIAYSPDESGTWGYGLGAWILNDHIVSSPGMFGSLPWIDTSKHYAAVLITLNLRTPQRQERYKELRQLVEDAVQQIP